MNASSELSPAAEAIAWNVHLLTQILVSLPAKSLFRFKSVSKQWRSLISDSQFAAKHHCPNPRPLIFLCWEKAVESFKCVSLQGDPTGPSLDYLLKQTGSTFTYRTKIIGSCNGLLLCAQADCFNRLRYFVCNPTTQVCKLIPEPHTRLVSSWSDALFVFDPSKSPHYKVVILSPHIYTYVYVGKPYLRIDIYSSKSASWKQLRPAVCYMSIEYPTFCSGVIYWLDNNGNVISGFDVDSEKLVKKKLPLKVPHLRFIKYFGECDGRLILIQIDESRDHMVFDESFHMVFDILETNDDYSHWIVKYRVNLVPLQLVSHDLEIYPQYSVKSVLKGEEKDFALVLAFTRKTVYYNLKCNTWNVLYDMPGSFHYYTTACSFIQTLHLI